MSEYVYAMECGCKWASSFPRTRGSRVPWCHDWLHRDDKRELVAGPFEEPRTPALHEEARKYDGYRVTPVYSVWRRSSDGYVGASAGTPDNLGHPYRPHDGVTRLTGYELLLATDDWGAAHARIQAERVADEMAEVAPEYLQRDRKFTRERRGS